MIKISILLRKNCLNCGKEYETCPTCEAMRGKVFAWRQDFCSTKCFKDYQTLGGLIMRIHTNGKTYTLKDYDYKKGLYTTTNDITLRQKEIQTFILSQEEFEELKTLNMPKKVDKNKISKGDVE